MKKIIVTIPLLLLILICFFIFQYLIERNDPNKPPSALINKQMPNFSMQNLYIPEELLTKNNLNKRIVLINFFASWCIPCKAEHNLFFKIKKEFPNIYIFGVNHKDKVVDAKKYLFDEGNPYNIVGIDNDGMVAFEFGVFGLPETFLINQEGYIIYKHLGPLTKKIINNEIKPLLQN